MNASSGVSSSDTAYTLTKSTATDGNTFNKVGTAVISSQIISSPKAFTVSNNTFFNFTWGIFNWYTKRKSKPKQI